MEKGLNQEWHLLMLYIPNKVDLKLLLDKARLKREASGGFSAKALRQAQGER